MKKTKMLKKNYEFKNILQKKNYYGGKQIEIFIAQNRQGINLLGIAVSKKIANSVQRNRVKRYVREAYRNIEDQIKEGYSIVILWKKKVDVEKANYHDIKKDLLAIFKNANMFKDKQ